MVLAATPKRWLPPWPDLRTQSKSLEVFFTPVHSDKIEPLFVGDEVNGATYAMAKRTPPGVGIATAVKVLDLDDAGFVAGRKNNLSQLVGVFASAPNAKFV